MSVDPREHGAHLTGGVVIAQVLEDQERLLPDLPGLREMAGRLAGLAEVGEGFRLGEAVAGFPVQAERALIAGGGVAEVAQMVLRVPQAVPHISVQPVVADFRAQGQCPAAEPAGLFVVAEEAVRPADVVERRGLGRWTLASPRRLPSRAYSVRLVLKWRALSPYSHMSQ